MSVCLVCMAAVSHHVISGINFCTTPTGTSCHHSLCCHGNPCHARALACGGGGAVACSTLCPLWNTHGYDDHAPRHRGHVPEGPDGSGQTPTRRSSSHCGPHLCRHIAAEGAGQLAGSYYWHWRVEGPAEVAAGPVVPVAAEEGEEHGKMAVHSHCDDTGIGMVVVAVVVAVAVAVVVVAVVAVVVGGK